MTSANGFRPSGLIKYYLKYHKMRTDAEEKFAILLCIQMIGEALGYHCVHYINPDVVRHNMYLALIGISSLSRKSTAQRIAKETYIEDGNFPNDFTPEAILEELALKSKGMVWYGEWTYLLKGVGNKGYMGRIVEVLNDIFECPVEYKRKIKTEDEYVEIKNAYLSFNTTCTPAMLEKYVNREMMEGGFFARFLIIDGEVSQKPRWRMSPEVTLMQKKIKWIIEKIELLTMGEGEVGFELDDEALVRFREIDDELSKNDKVGAFAGRYSNYILPIADILFISDVLGEFLNGNLRELDKYNTLMDLLRKLGRLGKVVKLGRLGKDNMDTSCRGLNNDDNNLIGYTLPNLPNLDNIIQIPSYYVDQAYEIIKPCMKYVVELANYVDVDVPIIILERYLKKHPTVRRSEAMCNTNLNANQMDHAVRTLVDQSKVDVVEKENIDTGKKTTWLRWVI